MSLHSFFAHFDLLADAPNAIPKLRELILQLAVRGKLVPQDPEDEPARVLLERIRAEKERLMREKKIRKQKPLPPVNLMVSEIDIPASWLLIRLGEIGEWGAGSTPDRTNTAYYGGSISWFKSGELNDTYIDQSEEKITYLALSECSLRLNQPGDVMIAMYGATIGKTAILQIEATTNQAICACTCYSDMYNRYLLLFLKAHKSRFARLSSGAAQPNISREKIINTVFPLPPLAEQQRIVARVDQLMAHCDELERQQEQRRAARLQLNARSLDQLLAASDPADLAADWQRIADSFELLYDAPETVGKLRQAILQLAVQGRLVPQDPNDEPASVLLEKIRAEKERLVREKKIKSTADSLCPYDTLYSIPGWEWVQLETILMSLRNGISEAPNAKDGIPILRISALRPNQVNIQEIRYLSTEGCQYEDYQLNKNDLLFTRYSGNRNFVGICGVVPEPQEAIVYPDKLIRGRLVENYIEPKYVSIAINIGTSRIFIEKFLKTTAGQVGIAGKDLKHVPIPLPPLAEQRRIVAKVDQLMALCDELEARLKQAQGDAGRLLEALVAAVAAR